MEPISSLVLVGAGWIFPRLLARRRRCRRCNRDFHRRETIGSQVAGQFAKPAYRGRIHLLCAAADAKQPPADAQMSRPFPLRRFSKQLPRELRQAGLPALIRPLRSENPLNLPSAPRGMSAT